MGVREVVLLLAAAGIGCGYRATPEALRLYRQGVTELHEGLYYEASQSLEKAAASDPRFAMAQARLTEAYFELDLSARAREELARVVPPDEALQLTLAGKFADAAAKYREMDDYIDLGRAYERDDKLSAALEAYRLATRRQPQNAAAWLRLGTVYARQLQQDRALEAFQRAEQLGARGVAYQRGLLAARLGNFEEARTLLAQTQEIPALLELSATDYRSGDVAESEAHAAKAIEIAHASGIEYLAAPGLLDLGAAYLTQGDDDAAAKAFVQSLEYAQRFHMERTQSRALLALGKLALRSGDLDRAIRRAQDSLELFQGGDAQALLARAQRQKGDYAEALRTLGASAPRDSGDILMMQGRWPEALAAYRAAHDSLDLAEVYWRLGRYQEALRAIADAGPSPDRAVATLGDRTRAGMALSQRDFAKAMELARSLSHQRNLSIDLTVEAKRILGTAQIATGAHAAGLGDLKYAAHLAEQSDSPLLLAETRLAYGDARAAQAWFAQADNLEGEWRSWQSMGNLDKARAALAALEKRWGDEDYKTYLARPDIAELLRRH